MGEEDQGILLASTSDVIRDQISSEHMDFKVISIDFPAFDQKTCIVSNCIGGWSGREEDELSSDSVSTPTACQTPQQTQQPITHVDWTGLLQRCGVIRRFGVKYIMIGVVVVTACMVGAQQCQKDIQALFSDPISSDHLKSKLNLWNAVNVA